MLRRRGFQIAGVVAVFLVIASGLWPSPKDEYDPIPAFQATDAVPCGDDIDSEIAFSNMIRNVKQFTNVAYTDTHERQTVSDKQSTFLTFMKREFVLSADGRYRYHSLPTMSNLMHSSTVIMDGEFHVSYSPDQDPKMLGIIPVGKYFIHPDTIVDFVCTTTLQATDFVGCKEFAGQKIIGYRRGLPDKHPRYDQFAEIWLNITTFLPVLIIETNFTRVRPRTPKGDARNRRRRGRPQEVQMNMRKTLSDFKWNAALDPASFEIELPAGWFIVDLQGVERALRAKIARRASSGG